MIDLNRLDAFLSASQAAQGLRLSLYLPTHRIHPDNKADPILYKNQLLKLQAMLEKEHPARGWEGLLKRMEALLEEGDLWRHTAQGLGVLAAGERVESFILERSVAPLVTAGACFHLLPLYHQEELLRDALLVDLSRDRYQAYQVSQNRLTPLRLEDVKDSFTALFDDPDLDANRDKLGHLRDREKYLRYLHEAFLRLHKEEGTQVILAGTRDTLSQFRSLAQSAPYLIGAIEQPLETLSDKQILSSARDILQPLYRAWLAALSTQLSNAHNAGKALTDLGEIRAAAREGRVGKLVISAQPPAGTLKTLDQVVSDALQSAAVILVVDQADKPLSRDHAAILRY